MKQNSHTSTLFHYTKDLSSLLSILRKGLNFSYCKEKYSENRCIGIPMISFCDIPIENSLEHRSKYGHYTIGLSKRYLIKIYKDAIGPLHYCMTDHMLNGVFQLKKIALSYKDDIYKNITPEDDPDEKLRKFIEYPYCDMAANMNIGLMKMYNVEHNGKNVIAYDECEWRIFVPEHARLNDRSTCKWYWSEKEYDDAKLKELGRMKVNISPLTFKVENIDSIIVDNINEINIIDDHLSDICGVTLKKDEKEILMSKIYSYNNLNKE